MKYMLDTNICIYAMKGLHNVRKNIISNSDKKLCISSITLAELLYGVEKSKAKARNRIELAKFMANFKILNFNSNAANEYGCIRSSLEEKGTPIGKMDMLIAAHAKSIGAVMVTNNVKEFIRVQGLEVEDWKQIED